MSGTDAELTARSQPLSHPREAIAGEDALLFKNKQAEADQQEYRNMQIGKSTSRLVPACEISILKSFG